MTLLSHEKLEIISSSKDSEVAKYRLELEIPGEFSKQKRKESIQAMKKHIDVPGFRKGTIPPFMMGELGQFVFRDCVEDMTDEAIKELDLIRYDGEDSQSEYDFETLKHSFKAGEDFRVFCDVALIKVLDDSDDSDDPDDIGDLEDIIKIDASDLGPEIELDEAKAEFSKALNEQNDL